jgi:lysophospholipase L1-like esterase
VKRTRRIELLGDSISAGYGSRGDADLHSMNICPVSDATCGNKYTYNWQIAEHFKADLVPIAWSGKGMYQNCCDEGEKMPSYYLQTLASQPFKSDWDFSRFTPDMMIINLGTNDFGHDAGPAWEASFSNTYTEFVLNATRRYKQPKLPISVAQGPMNNSPKLWAALNVSISAINAAGGNAIYLDLKGPPNDGCGGHRGVLGHKGMAEMAIPQIAEKMGWK